MRGSRIFGALVSASLFVLSGSGCGSKSTCDATKGLTLGVIYAKTGTLSQFGGYQELSVQVAQSEINRACGPLGGEVALEFRDDQSDETVAVGVAQDLVNNVKVPAIIGATGSGASMAVTDVTVPAGVLQISGSSASPDLTSIPDNDLFFRTLSSSGPDVEALAEVAYEDGKRNIAILSMDNAFATAMVTRFQQAFIAKGGTVVTVRKYPENAGAGYNYAPHINAVVPPTVASDSVFLMSYPEDGVAILQTWAAGAKQLAGSWYLGPSVSGDDFAAAVGAATVEGMKLATGAAPSGARFDKFKTAYAEFLGANPEDFDPEVNAATYDAVIAVALAIAHSGKAEGLAIRNSIRTVTGPPGEQVGPGDFQKALDLIKAGTDIDYQGANSPMDFDVNGDVAGDIEIFRYQVGEQVSIKVIKAD